MKLDSAVQYHYGQFPPEKLNYSQYINELTRATDALARYDQMLKNLLNSEILLAPLRNQEAVISSRMEGTISTMDEILEFEAEGDGSNEQGKFRSSVFETILYRRSLTMAQKAIEDGYDLNNTLLRSVHKELLSHGRGANKKPGEYKREQNYLGDEFSKDIRFIPIRVEKLNEGLDQLFDYMKRDDGQPDLIKTAVMHLEFEALHPFQDGNGRIGRMLITLHLWMRDVISAPHFYISAFMEEYKDAYIEKMREVSRTGDWDQWIKFFLIAVENQAKRNLAIAESIVTLYEDMKPKFADLLASKYSQQALDFIFTNPVFRNGKFTSQSGIPFGTAARLSRLLCAEGIIVPKEESSGRRSALFSFEALMKLVRV